MSPLTSVLVPEISDADELLSTTEDGKSSRSSSSEDSSEDEEVDHAIQDNLNDTPEAEIRLMTPPTTVPQKRRRGPKPKSLLFPLFFHIYAQYSDVITDVRSTTEPPALAAKMLTYILTLIPASETSKPASKRAVKSATLQLKSDEPWSTLEAQLLVKISALLKPKILNYEDYQVYFYIPRSVPKPGMILSNEDDYSILIQRATSLKKDPMINIDITEHGIDKAGKENAGPEADEGQPKKKRKQVRMRFCHLFMS
jgi:hypothetical protein